MAALEARSLLTRETIPSPDARYPNRVGDIVRMVGGLRRNPHPEWQVVCGGGIAGLLAS